MKTAAVAAPTVAVVAVPTTSLLGRLVVDLIGGGGDRVFFGQVLFRFASGVGVKDGWTAARVRRDVDEPRLAVAV